MSNNIDTGKFFVFDTDILGSKRGIFTSFGSDNTICVPFCVIEEADAKFAHLKTERGKIVRHNLAYLRAFRIKELQKGVTQENGSILRVVLNTRNQTLSDAVKNSKLTELEKNILEVCLSIKAEAKDKKVVLISKNTPLQYKAELLGITVQTFRDELLPELNEQYTGRAFLNVPDEKIKEFRTKGYIALTSIVSEENFKTFYQNMFVELKGKFDFANGRVDGNNIVKLQYEDYHPFKVIPKNVGQKFAIEALMTNEKQATLVILKGVAGTAKTFLSLATGLEHVESLHEFKGKILISRLPIETGESIGYLPGDEEGKIMPYLRGTLDNLVNLQDDNDIIKPAKPKNNFNKGSSSKTPYGSPENDTSCQNIYFQNGIIRAEAIGYIRGRSICNTFIIIDEAQNLSPAEVKTIITRVGFGTKLVLVGDPSQVDRPDLDERNNGLSYASEHFKGDPLCWQLTFTDDESVRSELAKRASMIL